MDACKMHGLCEHQSALLEVDRRRALSEVPVICERVRVWGRSSPS